MENNKWYLHDIRHAIVRARAQVYGHEEELSSRAVLDQQLRDVKEEVRRNAGDTWLNRRSGALDRGQVIDVFDVLSSRVNLDGVDNSWKLHTRVLFTAEEITLELPHNEEQYLKHEQVVAELRARGLRDSSPASFPPAAPLPRQS